MPRRTFIYCLGCLSLLIPTADLFAGKGAELKPLAKPGSIVLDDDFSGKELSKKFTANKGTWQIQDGALVGREKNEDMHGAVLTLAEPNRNSIIRFSFKLDGATSFSLSFNHDKGHLFRVTATETGVSLIKDADKKDPNSKPKVYAQANYKLAAGEWHTLLVEMQGDKVSVQSDQGWKLQMREPSLDVEKTGYRFVTRGESLLIDDIKIWSVSP